MVIYKKVNSNNNRLLCVCIDRKHGLLKFCIYMPIYNIRIYTIGGKMKTKWLQIRVSEEEHNFIKKSAGDKTISEFILSLVEKTKTSKHHPTCSCVVCKGQK